MSDLDLDQLLRAYELGVFPMADARDADSVFWVEPRRRAIIPLDRFHLSASLRKTLRSGRYTVTSDRAFADVVRACADRKETWINPDIEKAYVGLHQLGHAHSVECWVGDDLVGGLYGVERGRAFFGESMFSRGRDASKIALAWLVARLRIGGYQLLDCQFMTEHLRSLGAVEIQQRDYLSLLSSALASSAEGGGAAGGWSLSAAGDGTADFGALDRLLAEDPARTVDSSASGCVIAQLLGQTS